MLGRGGDAGQALKEAAVNGLIDFTLSYLLMKAMGAVGKGAQGKGLMSKAADTGKVIGLNAAQMAGGQALREAADEAIMGDQSRRAIRLRALMEQGLSQEQAEKVLFEQDLRDLGSIAPIVAGLTQNSVIRGLRAASDVGDSVRRYEDGDGYGEGDMEIAKILQDDAPRKPFTDEAEGGIMEGDEAQYFDPVQQSSGKTGTNQILWDSWQNYPKVEMNGRQYAKVGDRLYSKHAVERMQPSGNRFGPNIFQGINGSTYGRSISPQYVEYIISTSKPDNQTVEKISYKSGTVEIITNRQGAVITIMTYKKPEE